MTALNVHLSLSLALSSLFVIAFVNDRSSFRNSGAVTCLIWSLIQIATALLILNP